MLKQQAIKAIIFDFDGTLVNTVDVFLKMFLEIGSRYGNGVTAGDFYAKNGMPARDSIRSYIKEGKFKWWIIPYFLLNARRMNRRINKEAAIYPKVHEVLRGLRQYYKIGLVSNNNSQNVNFLFNKFNLASYFEHVITRDDVRYEKPHPEPYLKMAKLLGEVAENCLAVEDSPIGILAARRANMWTCAVEHNTPQQYFEGEKAPNRFIPKIANLSKDFIEKAY